MEALDHIPLATSPKNVKATLQAIQKNRYLLAKKIQQLTKNILMLRVTKEDKQIEARKSNQECNLFKEQPSETEFKSELGPRYHQNGDLVKYTVVGNTDWFIRQQQGKRTQFDEAAIKRTGSKVNKQDEEKSVVIRSYENRSQSKKLSVTDKKVKVREQVRTKIQIVDDIAQIKNRILNNRVIEERDLMGLDPLTKRVISKDQRILDSYTTTLNEWDAFVQRSSCNLERKAEMSQFNRADAYRNKLEVAHTLETLKTDSERFGSRLWYMTLRQSVQGQTQSLHQKKNSQTGEEGINAGLIVSADLPEGFKHSLFGGTKSTTEFIRKPNQSSDHKTLFLNKSGTSIFQNQTQQQQIPFHSFHSEQYLKSRMEDLSCLHGKKSLIEHHYGEDQLANLMIYGEAQFEREANVALKDGFDSTQVYKKFVIKNPDDQDQREEIIASNYSYRDRHFLPLLNKKVLKTKIQFKRQPSLGTSNTFTKGNITQSEFFDSQNVK